MFKKYPFIKQESLKDCGLACTLMIVKYYHGNIPRNKLKEMLKITKAGISAYHIVNTLNELGFNAKGIKQEKLTVTSVPFIAHMKINNSYYHYVTVYKVTDSYVLLADPADKIKRVSLEQFYQEWTGIKIVMYPLKPIVKIKNTNYLKILKNLFVSNKKTIIKIALISLIMTFSAIASTLFWQFIIDDIHNKYLKIIFSLFVALLTVKIFTNYFRNKLVIKLTNSFDECLTKNTFKHIIELPYLYYYNHTHGEIVSKISDLSKAKDIIIKILLIILIDLPLTFFSGIFLLAMNKQLFGVLLFIIFLHFLTIKAYQKKLTYQINNNLKQKAEIYSYMSESIGGFETVKGLNIEDNICLKFINKYNPYLMNTNYLNTLINKMSLANNIITELRQALIIIIGIMLVKNNEISLGLFITYNALSNLFLEPIKNIFDLNFEIKEAISSIRRVLDLYEDKQKINNEEIKNIKLKKVSLTFDDEKLVLKNIDLTIKQGEKILIAGKSGSGKSTLIKLIKGYYSNYEGDLFINDKPLISNTNISLISSNETIFTGTILENITLKGNKDLKNIQTICLVDEILNNYHLKENALLEENGLNISGGQRQRIALARALQSFNVLVIDEGLSGLDINLERRLLKNLFKEYSDKTIIVISHRLDNLDLFSRFIKMQAGEIILDEKRNR